MGGRPDLSVMNTAPSPNLHAVPFHTTRWTRVCLAKADSEEGRRALADLCDAYYEPVVAYLRSVLRDADAARDMSHAFFVAILEGGRIHSADRQRGRFRAYLLGAVKHFLAHDRVAAQRMKRGVRGERLIVRAVAVEFTSQISRALASSCRASRSLARARVLLEEC